MKVNSSVVAQTVDPTDPPKKPFITWPKELNYDLKVSALGGVNQSAPGSYSNFVLGLGGQFEVSANFNAFKLKGSVGADYAGGWSQTFIESAFRPDYYSEYHPRYGHQYKTRIERTRQPESRLDVASLGLEVPIGKFSLGLAGVLGFNITRPRENYDIVVYQNWRWTDEDCYHCVDQLDREADRYRIETDYEGTDNRGMVISVRPEMSYDFDWMKLGLSYTHPVFGKESSQYGALFATFSLDDLFY